MKVLIVTRDLKHGEGHHVMNLLKVLKVSPVVDKVHILAPGRFPIESDKFSYTFFNPLGNTFVTRQPHSATKTPPIIEKIITRERIDIVHTHYPLFTKKLSVPLVSTFHFLNYTRLKSNHFAIPELVATDPFHFIYQLFDDRTINISDKVILVSKNTRDILIRKYKSKCNKFEYMPNFVDTTLFSPNAVKKRSDRLNDEFNILFVGRLDRSKGFDQMVKVMDEFRQKKMPFKLNVVGSGPLERLATHAPNINLLGRVDNNKLPSVYNSNDCFILPSVYENCPMSIIEAMSCGSPVIASDVGDVRNLMHDDELLLRNISASEIFEKITTLFNYSIEKREEIGARNREHAVDQFDLRHATRIIDIYKTTMEQVRDRPGLVNP